RGVRDLHPGARAHVSEGCVDASHSPWPRPAGRRCRTGIRRDVDALGHGRLVGGPDAGDPAGGTGLGGAAPARLATDRPAPLRAAPATGGRTVGPGAAALGTGTVAGVDHAARAAAGTGRTRRRRWQRLPGASAPAWPAAARPRRGAAHRS